MSGKLSKRSSYHVFRLVQDISIHGFAEQGDLLEVIDAVEKDGVDINERDSRRQTPLHCACFAAHTKVAEYLVGRGADVEARDMQQVTPLHLASGAGSAESCTLLIANGASVNATDYKNSTPLHWACQRGQYNCVAKLVACGADPLATNSEGKTPKDVIGELCEVKRETVRAIKSKLRHNGSDFFSEIVALKQTRNVLEIKISYLERELRKTREQMMLAMKSSDTVDLSIEERKHEALIAQLRNVRVERQMLGDCCVVC